MGKPRIYSAEFAFDGEFYLSVDGDMLGIEVRGKEFKLVDYADYAKAIAALKWIGGVDESKPYCTYYERTLDDGTTVPTTTEIAEAVLKELGES